MNRYESEAGRWLRAALVMAMLAVVSVPGARAGSFVLVGLHPDATNQSTGTGRTLAALAGFNGKLYAGFGDYNANTGPIGLRPFNPATGTFGSRLLNSQTDALYLFREIGGRLYAPDIDPVAGESTGGYAVGSVNGATESWQHKSPVQVTHMYDIAAYGDSLWMAGSQGNNAVVWRSTDAGTNWSLSLSVPPSGSYSYVRIYGMGVYSNRLYVDVDAEARTRSHVFDGSGWSDGPALCPGGSFMSNPGVVAGCMVYQSFECGLGASRLYKFDGTSAAYVGTNSFFDYKIAGDRLYGLVGVYVPGGGSAGMTLTGTLVQCTADLVNWEPVAAAPLAARSLALVNGGLFLGGLNGQLWQYTEPVGPLPFATVQATDAAASEEGPDGGKVVIRRYGATNLDLTVYYALSGSASNGADYTALADGSCTVPAGSTELSFTVMPVPDGQTEGREKVVLTVLTNGAYDIYGPTSAVVSIVDQPLVSMAGADTNACEWPLDAATVTVMRAGYTNQAITVALTRSGTASAGDYVLGPGLSVPVAAGVTSVAVTVVPVFDTNVENSAETLILTVATNATYLVDSSSNATVSIQDLGMAATSNGAPVTWLRRYGLVTNTFDRMEWTDTDRDGMVAWQEYWAGTDPTNPSSTFKLTAVDCTNGITWLGGTNGATAPYQVLWSTNPSAGTWQVGTNVPRSQGVAGTYSWRDPRLPTSDWSRVFYRIAAPTN